MPDNLKLLTKDYFNRHPVKEYSAARLEYSMLLMPEVMDVVDEKLPEMREMAAKRGIDIPDTTEQMKRVEEEEDTGKLLRMLRQTHPPVVRKAVREKLLKREMEVLPEIQRMILKAFNDNTIENCVRFMTKCETDCTEWIMRHYDDVREPYARSISTRMCMVTIFTCPSTFGFQRGFLTLAGMMTVPLCSAQAWKSLLTLGLIQSLFSVTATLQLSGVTV